jgi:plasmid stabilization system protein ParE
VAVRWAAEAVRDLEEIHVYISRHSPRYAAVTVGRLVEAAERVAGFPESGRVVPELGDPAVREVIEGAYRVVYEVASGALTVLTVFRASRQFPLER